MRIVAGRHRGRRLVAPKGLAVRPTSDRAREALFSRLEHGEPPLRGARFLDVFAGTGAHALEALSRGAASAVLIERDPQAVAAIRHNLETLGETAEVLATDATRLGRARQPADIAVLDPPYRQGLTVPALNSLARGWLAQDARVICEIGADETLELPPGYEFEDERRYGAARLVFLRFVGDQGSTGT
ncbi:MAG: 16S rRNA (guanine(966)-N(2))-methyltransferase RsmD [Geminicoccaceae bacterium]